MKKIFLPLISLFLIVSGARADTTLSALGYLNAMAQSHVHENYEQIYIFQEGEDEMGAWRYRHTRQDSKEYAQLISLDGLREEFLLQGNVVGYFGYSQPFSLKTDKILDYRPSILYTDFNQLEGYNFIDMGKDRVADKIARVIRIVPNDDFRYQYRLWIDEQSKLLLKSELSDRSGLVLELFKVQSLKLDDELLNMAEVIRSITLPPLISSQNDGEIQSLNWNPKWLPKGFKLRAIGKQQLPDGELVDSQIYSDGIFSFTLYLAKSQGSPLREHFWQDGKTTLYTQSVENHDVIIVGEIPLATARHLLQEIELKSPLVGERK